LIELPFIEKDKLNHPDEGGFLFAEKKTKKKEVSLFFYFSNIYSIIDVTIKPIAIYVVYFDSIASMVLPLFLPKKVSAPPAILPERPAALPD